MKLKTILISIVVLIMLAWLILFFSSKAILIHSEVAKNNESGLNPLTCTYFTGTGIFKRRYVSSASSNFIAEVVGRPACPRLTDI